MFATKTKIAGLALLGLVTVMLPLLTPPPATAAVDAAFRSQGMWIWYASQAERGNVRRIAFQARRHKVRSVFLKSSDGSRWWKQFDQYAAPLKAAGLRVCAWQYIYGRDPIAEANLGARAVRAGADCLVINAEVEYRSKHTQAQRYLTQLRAQIGSKYPVGFTSFAYPDFHPTVPYSVFLGPGGAQWNLPQMYFKAFKSKIRSVFFHTYSVNQVYQRPIHPLGQTYQRVRYSEALKFRKYVKRYRARGYSWWAWHETSRRTWKALRRKVRRQRRKPLTPYPELRSGNKSDLVRWCRLKLNASGAELTDSLSFDRKMVAALKLFQLQNGLVPSGRMDQATWPVLQTVRLPAPAD